MFGAVLLFEDEFALVPETDLSFPWSFLWSLADLFEALATLLA
jgi:hypothetical protein